MVIFPFTFFNNQICDEWSHPSGCLGYWLRNRISILLVRTTLWIIRSGVDISDLMIRQAMNKCKKQLNSNNLILFPECFDFVIKYNDLINSLINQNFVRKKNSTPSFLISDLFHLPFSNDYFSHINCCGSVISLVEDSHLALNELTRV